MPQRILLIGGPSTGKTTLLNYLASLHYPCLEEVSREVIKNAQKEGIDQLFLEKPLLFSELLRDARIQQYIEAGTYLADYVFIDRGLQDTTAYMDFIKQPYPDSFTASFHRYRYDKVFILPLWREIHTTDNERYESFDQAQAIQQELLSTYMRWDYTPVEVPIGPVDQRAAFILNTLKD